MALLIAWCSAGYGQVAPEVLREATAHDQKAREFLAKRDWKAAIAEFDQALRLDRSRADTLIGLGIARWGGGDHAGAIQAFQQAVSLDPASPDAHFNIGVAWKELGETAKASEELKAALRIKPGHLAANLEYAMLLQESGQLEQAVTEYQRVLKTNPNSARSIIDTWTSRNPISPPVGNTPT